MSIANSLFLPGSERNTCSLFLEVLEKIVSAFVVKGSPAIVTNHKADGLQPSHKTRVCVQAKCWCDASVTFVPVARGY